MTSEPYIHVIMPVGSDPLYTAKRSAIAAGLTKIGIEARFPDYLPHRPAFDLRKMIDEIAGADSVIVDLSHERPSCYYELGLAEALGKRTLLIAEAGTPIHQTAARSLVRYYRTLDDITRFVQNMEIRSLT